MRKMLKENYIEYSYYYLYNFFLDLYMSKYDAKYTQSIYTCYYACIVCTCHDFNTVVQKKTCIIL